MGQRRAAGGDVAITPLAGAGASQEHAAQGDIEARREAVVGLTSDDREIWAGVRRLKTALAEVRGTKTR